ncbi:Zinc finger protein [Gossypium arboreum]|uniref:Zinc finger protein n=1 Tax=Gossypium arboreum TaxID=29729 RepID=A0A0B0P5H2_GOSAR|nr:Zinc finger protein [Gossypium arboreum]
MHIHIIILTSPSQLLCSYTNNGFIKADNSLHHRSGYSYALTPSAQSTHRTYLVIGKFHKCIS